MNLPLVSVIVPNYNYARYLGVRIESILNQTYENYEIILLDDKSTDNSLDIIEKYKAHPKVSKVILSEVNSGSPFIQWEKGIKASRGEIIWIAESDDNCSPFFLEKLVGFHLHSNAVMTFCRSSLIGEDGHTLRENLQMRNVTEDFCMNGKQFVKKYLCYSNEIQNASAVIFNRSEALSIDDSFTAYKGAGDWFFWITLSLRGIVSFVNEELNYYRLHNNTTSKVVNSGLEFREMKKIYDWLLVKGLLIKSDYDKCRSNNIRLIRSISAIPQKVKTELYKMWNVSFCYRYFLELCDIVASLKR